VTIGPVLEREKEKEKERERERKREKERERERRTQRETAFIEKVFLKKKKKRGNIL
jgi:hypothetical protein